MLSNQFSTVQEFRKRQSKGCIIKSHTPYSWSGGDGASFNYTSLLSEGLSEQDVVENVGILQERVLRSHELRVFVCDGTVYPYSIKNIASLDARRDINFSSASIQIEETTLESALADKVRDLMGVLGMTTGSVDFLVREDGCHIFLEINEAGRFLWLDKYGATNNLLAAFGEFVLGNPAPTASYRDQLPSLAQYLTDVSR
ncbi:MAG: hypothetical protein P1U83_19715 [Roseovarius sp.]|nr:hypothetical protein [Roseovarius sp.]